MASFCCLETNYTSPHFHLWLDELFETVFNPTIIGNPTSGKFERGFLMVYVASTMRRSTIATAGFLFYTTFGWYLFKI